MVFSASLGVPCGFVGAKVERLTAFLGDDRFFWCLRKLLDLVCEVCLEEGKRERLGYGDRLHGLRGGGRGIKERRRRGKERIGEGRSLLPLEGRW